MTGAPRSDPFAVLGLPPDGDVSDDDVRAAWRRIAAATHPDRTDGGDPERFALAAAAYTELRTSFGRGEARAAAAGLAWGTGTTRLLGTKRWSSLGARIAHGRPVRLSLRLAVAVVAGLTGVLTAGPGSAAAPALAVGAATWFVLTSRQDLGPP